MSEASDNGDESSSDEENGLFGGKAYAKSASKNNAKHLFALE